MPNYEPTAAAAVVGLAGFQLLQAWNNNAPSLSDVRAAPPGNNEDWVKYRQQLQDADFLVGGLATILGVAFAVISKDITALLVMLVIFGTVSLWYHSVLNAESR